MIKNIRHYVSGTVMMNMMIKCGMILRESQDK